MIEKCKYAEQCAFNATIELLANVGGRTSGFIFHDCAHCNLRPFDSEVKENATT